jgi:hypothetical protein
MTYTKYPAPTVDELSTEWVKHFYSFDRAIQWGEIEQEKSLWLDDQTLLVGKIDAQGLTEDGDHFFADWKTISNYYKNRMDAEKSEYRLDPQMLTYGVLCAADESGFRGLSRQSRFMVRWAMKNSPPLFFYEWYRYSPTEIAWWRAELLLIADQIRHDKEVKLDRYVEGHFTPNLTNCFKYGPKNVCPFYEPACSKQNWSGRDANMIPRVSHLEIEREYQSKDLAVIRGDVVILDATRVDTWLTCNEKYRRQYVENVVMPVEAGSALDIGLQFHEQMASYYTRLKESQNG